MKPRKVLGDSDMRRQRVERSMERWNKVIARLGLDPRTDYDDRLHTTVWPNQGFDTTTTYDRDAFRKNPSIPEWAIPFNYHVVAL